METRTLQIVELRKTDETFPAEKMGELVTEPPEEVGGRCRYNILWQCSSCGFVGRKTPGQRIEAYTCLNCGTVVIE